MKKILRWTAATGGWALIFTGVFGGINTEMPFVLMRLGLITAGIVLFMAALLTMPGGRKRQKYQEWNYRDAYADELEARQRAKASWDSIRRANEK